jgi:hypothetical protein
MLPTKNFLLLASASLKLRAFLTAISTYDMILAITHLAAHFSPLQEASDLTSKLLPVRHIRTVIDGAGEWKISLERGTERGQSEIIIICQ